MVCVPVGDLLSAIKYSLGLISQGNDIHTHLLKDRITANVDLLFQSCFLDHGYYIPDNSIPIIRWDIPVFSFRSIKDILEGFEGFQVIVGFWHGEVVVVGKEL